MPIRRAASAFCTTASIALPSRVLRAKKCRLAASARPTAGIASCSIETCRPASSSEALAHGSARPRGSLPKVKSTLLSAMIPSATVAISQAFEPRLANGRTASSSTIRPYTAQRSSDIAAASTNGQPRRTAKV